MPSLYAATAIHGWDTGKTLTHAYQGSIPLTDAPAMPIGQKHGHRKNEKFAEVAAEKEWQIATPPHRKVAVYA